ncbi:hypothetical protein HUU05_01835 [candidate division KSB1 bacterium]|nr:hypothetical protein [candidate division KSB1 bacterium]
MLAFLIAKFLEQVAQCAHAEIANNFAERKQRGSVARRIDHAAKCSRAEQPVEISGLFRGHALVKLEGDAAKFFRGFFVKLGEEQLGRSGSTREFGHYNKTFGL